MRVSHWWYALLVLGYAQMTYAEEAAQNAAGGDTTAMEVIEMLGEMDDEITILDIAMSDVNLNEKVIAKEVNNAE
ncbi:MAG: hypothetical protein WA632_09885 [Gallionella sp.]